MANWLPAPLEDFSLYLRAPIGRNPLSPKVNGPAARGIDSDLRHVKGTVQPLVGQMVIQLSSRRNALRLPLRSP